MNAVKSKNEFVICPKKDPGTFRDAYIFLK